MKIYGLKFLFVVVLYIVLCASPVKAVAKCPPGKTETKLDCNDCVCKEPGGLVAECTYASCSTTELITE